MSDRDEVAEEVLRFWLEETPAEKRFARDDALDAVIAQRFGALRAEVVAARATSWRERPRTLLAAVVLIDQFGRNLFRGQATAFAADPLARALAREALIRRWDRDLTSEEQRFLYLPLMHSEALEDQLRSVALFGALGDEGDYAVRHAAQIARFGRFPGRNAALGRVNTAAEERALAEGGGF